VPWPCRESTPDVCVRLSWALEQALSLADVAPTLSGPPTGREEYLLVTERMWDKLVITHDSEPKARAHASRFWSGWVLFVKDPIAGGLTAPWRELGCGGFTLGGAHKKLRKYVADGKADGSLMKRARRPSISLP